MTSAVAERKRTTPLYATIKYSETARSAEEKPEIQKINLEM